MLYLFLCMCCLKMLWRSNQVISSPLNFMYLYLLFNINLYLAALYNVMEKQSSYIQPRSFLSTWHGKAINQHRNSSIIVVITVATIVIIVIFIVVIIFIVIVVIIVTSIDSISIWKLWCISVHLILRTQCIVVEQVFYKIVIIIFIIMFIKISV